ARMRHLLSLSWLTTRGPPRSPLFPYTTLFRSVVRREQPRMMVAQRDYAGTRQRGDVDHGARLEPLHVSERVAQDQTAFGVGVQRSEERRAGQECRTPPRPRHEETAAGQPVQPR